MLPLCQALGERLGYQPAILLEADPDGSMQEMCAACSVPCMVDSQTGAAQRQNEKGGGVGGSSHTPALLAHVRRDIARLRKLLKTVQPLGLILLDDRTMFTARLIRAAELERIPTMVVQWAATYSADTFAAIRAAAIQPQERTRRRSIVERIVARLVPHGVRQVGNQRAWWFFSPEQTLSHWLLGAFPRTNPWIYGGGNANMLAVWGPVWKRMLVDDGVAPDKIVVTGHPQHDSWFQLAHSWSAQDRAETMATLGMRPEQVLITVAASALQFRKAGAARYGDVSIEQMQDYLRFVVQTARQIGEQCAVVVKVHPRDYDLDFGFLNPAGDPSIQVVRSCDIARLFAASAVVLCQWSTTAMTARSLGVPVVSFDFHNVPSSTVWKHAAGIVNVSRRDQLEPVLRAVLCDATLRRELAEERDQFVGEYLCFDGQATERIVQLIAHMLKRKQIIRQ